MAEKFQSAPADCRREKSLADEEVVWLKSFNPLPPTVGGRSGRDRSELRSSDRFNPLPPSVGGRRPPGSGPLRWTSSFNPPPADCRREK